MPRGQPGDTPGDSLGTPWGHLGDTPGTSGPPALAPAGLRRRVHQAAERGHPARVHHPPQLRQLHLHPALAPRGRHLHGEDPRGLSPSATIPPVGWPTPALGCGVGVIPLSPTLSPPQAILSMLQDMNFINTYKMDRQTLTRWVPIPTSACGTPGQVLGWGGDVKTPPHPCQVLPDGEEGLP